MPIPIRVLILDHRPSDAELMLHELRQSGFEPDWQRVDTEADYLAQLQRDFDVILADYSLPQLDWVCALNLLREHSLDIPFILVTDGINEKVTVECLKQGAANCLPKDRLERLGQAVTDVLQEKKPRDEERGAKAALQANEKLFQSLIENVSDIVMLTDGERTISYASPSVKRVLGHEPEDIVGRKTSDFVHPDDVSGFISTFTSPAQRPGFVSLPEVRIRHRDGSWRVFEGVANNRLDDPAVAGIVINCRDITERKRMEETIRKERDFISAVLDTTSALVVVLDREGRIARFNRAYEQTSGYSFEEIKGKYLWDMLLSPQVAESVKAMIEHIETDLFPSEYETSWVTKDGDRRLITWSNAVLYDDEGRAEYGIGVGIDITDRKHAEEVLQRQLEELIVLHTVATAAAEATDEDTLIEHATQAMDKMLDADRFGVMLLDRVVGGLRIHPSYRGQAERVGWGEQMIIPLGHHIVGQVAADGCPRCVSAVLPNTTCLRRHDPPYPDSGIYSQLCVPLKGSEGLIGVLNTESERRDAFSETDERLLTTFAGQLATAIEKVRLMEMLKQRVSDRTRELSALYDVTALANESLEVDEMLKRLLEYVLAAMGCNVGTVHLLDEAGETLHLVTQQGLSANVVNRIDFLPVDGSLEGIVIKRGEPLVSLDLATDPRTIKIAQWERGHAYIGVPVQVRGQAMGVLGVTGEMGKRFTMEEVSLMAAIADHAGVVMENTQLRQKTEETAITRERRRLARELHDSVTQSAYSMTLLADAGRELTKAGRLEQAEEYLTRLGEIAQQMLKDMRLLVYELRPLALTQVGLLGALRQRLEIVERRANVDARIVADELLVLPIPVEQALYRIAQEALNNILKHSKATAVTVYIHAKEGWVELEVVDDGLGFDPDATHDKRGIGLIAMSERVEQLGGTLQVISAPGEGTRVKVAFNCQQSAISRG